LGGETPTDDLVYGKRELDRSIIAPNRIRTVSRPIATPSRPVYFPAAIPNRRHRPGTAHQAIPQRPLPARCRHRRHEILEMGQLRWRISMVWNRRSAPVADTGIAKIFKHGRSQAVRLPKEFRLPGTEVRVRRVGRSLASSISAWSVGPSTKTMRARRGKSALPWHAPGRRSDLMMP
jgi:hypothetical protein